MATYTVEGWVKLNGVHFTVDADTEEEAKEKIAKGDWTDYDASGAETTDWDLRPRTLRKDE